MSQRALPRKRRKIRRGQRRPEKKEACFFTALRCLPVFPASVLQRESEREPHGLPSRWSPLFAPVRRLQRGIRASSILVYFAILALSTVPAASRAFFFLSRSGSPLLWQREPSCPLPPPLSTFGWTSASSYPNLKVYLGSSYLSPTA